ncbi:hypothetical protein G5I_00456 [Acromyrmex echinatior]|uniref:Uncharacterized protein n=1 Tax=Acromyrmex echinatior TaxID=103372 RepID=F4W4X3_ACREC|nr:hypothetical protein G5I_00456 [Acromyrmex echinatior]
MGGAGVDPKEEVRILLPEEEGKRIVACAEGIVPREEGENNRGFLGTRRRSKGCVCNVGDSPQDRFRWMTCRRRSVHGERQKGSRSGVCLMIPVPICPQLRAQWGVGLTRSLAALFQGKREYRFYQILGSVDWF